MHLLIVELLNMRVVQIGCLKYHISHKQKELMGRRHS